MAQAHEISVIPYSPTGGGLLSGKYAGGGENRGRLHTNKMYTTRYGDEWMHEVAARFVAFCKDRGLHPVSAAVAWVGAHPAVTAPIIGARNVEQLHVARLGVDRHDSGASSGDLRPLAHTAACDGSVRGGIEELSGVQRPVVQCR